MLGGTLVRASGAHILVINVWSDVFLSLMLLTFLGERRQRESSVPPDVGECHEQAEGL